MARYSGGPVTHRALTGPSVHPEDPRYRHELLYTLQCVREVRAKVDRNELETVRKARRAGVSWTEIATSLGVSRQAVWERWHEIDAG
jgi:DNA invertase Pin-like site-specific DNA recombinase